MNITAPEQWQAERLQGIGASEASAVIGKNPWMSNVDLWRIKTGRKAAEDISDKACVQYGHDAEPLIRGLFALDYKDIYKVEYRGAFDMVRSAQHPFIFATLDGRLTETATGRLGVYEGKTTEILRSMQREKWRTPDGRPRLPDNYYVQVLHQLLATGWEYAVLHAQLKSTWGTEFVATRRTFVIERAEVQADLDFLLEHELRFWEYVQNDHEPPRIIDF